MKILLLIAFCLTYQACNPKIKKRSFSFDGIEFVLPSKVENFDSLIYQPYRGFKIDNPTGSWTGYLQLEGLEAWWGNDNTPERVFYDHKVVGLFFSRLSQPNYFDNLNKLNSKFKLPFLFDPVLQAKVMNLGDNFYIIARAFEGRDCIYFYSVNNYDEFIERNY